MKKIILICLTVLSIAVKSQGTQSIVPLPMGARLPQVATTTNSLIANSNMFREYQILLTQSSTTAPTGTVVFNSLATITPSYVATGIYQFTCNACFTATRTTFYIQNNIDNLSSFAIERTSASILTLTTNILSESGDALIKTPTNGLLTATPLVIKVRQ